MSSDPPPKSTPSEKCPLPDEPAIRIEPRLARQPRPDPQFPSRISLGYFYLWVTCAAIDLAVLRALITDEPRLTGLALLTLHAIVAGGVWAGMVVFVSRIGRGVRAPIEPGEWLNAALGVRLILELVLTATSRVQFLSPAVVLVAVTACMLVLPIVSGGGTRRWNLFFYLFLAVQCVPLAFVVLGVAGHTRYLPASAGWTNWLPAVANILLIVLALFFDLRSRVTHSWLHWLGLLFWFLILGMSPVIRLLW